MVPGRVEGVVTTMEASSKWVARFGWLAILALVANAAVASFNINSLILGERDITHTHEVMAELDGILAATTDAETGQRGYIITGDPEYLRPYRSAVEAIEERFKSLWDLIVDNDGQQNRMRPLEAVVRNRFAVLQRIIEVQDREGREAAREALRNSGGFGLMQQVRARAKEMRAVEEALLEERSVSARLKYRAAIVTNLLGAAIGIAMVLFAYRLNRKEYERRLKVEARIAESEERFRTLAETAPQVVWDARPDGSRDYFNQRWYTYTGLTAEETRGDRWMETLHPEDVEATRAAWEHSLRTGAAFELEQRFRRHDGKYRWFLSLAQPQVDEKGKVVRWIGTLTDIHEQKRTVGELKETRRFLKAVFNAVPAHQAVLEADGTIITVGDSWQDFVTGNGMEAPAEWSGTKYFHPCDEEADAAKALAGIEAVVRKETDLFEMEYPCHGVARRRWFLMRASRFRGAGAVRLVVSHEEVTGRVEAENALRASVERFRGLTEAMPQMVWTADANGDINWTNQRWSEFLGRESGDLHGEGWKSVVHPDDRPCLDEHWRETVQKRKERFSHEYRMTRRDGTWRWVRSDAVPLADAVGRIEQWVGALTDIDDQKREAEHLERRVRERTAELVDLNDVLNRTAEELRGTNQELEKFAYVASHDLQEPLRKIQAFGNLLLSKHGDALPDEGRDYIGRMNSSAGRMRVLIDDLLRFSRVATKGQPFTSVRLDDVMNEVRSDLEVRLAETGGRIEADPLPEIAADPTQMRQVFQNLISNSLKFRKPGIPPLIRLTAERIASLQTGDEGSGWRILLRDNGIGFEDQYREKIFEVFQRLHGRAEFEGTGIGLAIVRKIVERHGGQITARGVPGQGAAFTIELPDRPADNRSSR